MEEIMVINTWSDAMEYIRLAEQYGSVLGLKSMKQLLKELNNPEDKLKFIHIAGTNGKGSTGAFISFILAASGYKVGRYISPSVLEYEEKIHVLSYNQDKFIAENINKEEIFNSIKEIQDACDRMVEKGYNHPTIFEIETAMSFLHFVHAKCDIVVLEVGMGGRLDATNVVNQVVCSVITSISMDHMDYLGDTIEKIAAEKAGIIKKNTSVISYEQEKKVEEVLKCICKENDSPFTMADFKDIIIVREDLYGTEFSYKNYKNLTIRLLGRNQVYNGVTALLVIEELIKLGYNIQETAIRKGFRETRWRGRFEMIAQKPIVVVDGAHNEDGAKALGRNIETYFKGKRLIYIMGVLKDKDYEGILKHTSSYAEAIITITPNNKRGLSSKELAKSASKYCQHVVDADSIESGVSLGLQMAGEEDIILIFGSLSYLADIYKEFKIL